MNCLPNFILYVQIFSRSLMGRVLNFDGPDSFAFGLRFFYFDESKSLIADSFTSL